jgi:hypothetical protein
MKYLIAFISAFLIFKSSFISTNVISRNEAREFMKDHVWKLKGLSHLDELFAQRPKGGNDDPTVNYHVLIMPSALI